MKLKAKKREKKSARNPAVSIRIREQGAGSVRVSAPVKTRNTPKRTVGVLD